ncbi:SDR family NAD(P)-dependent oxidoreductase [Nocardia macrotermitis]|uniref:3-oxoacyl-[acyl-carrier-protein] reductase FabG n=1 Tax=Nocardia macrotermitis TaxID=2585198 RepID=A0A7K0D3K3_9NOCA|nr:SDR family oxidoreductase [Nocardia macrotermitis]MQY20211.1 3-oxoacyl-[acyl-carrier-protein] reductase FabG [Nocardia macrotermitis]
MSPRVVVVSGGGTGIGRATAQRFAHSGEQTVLLGRRLDRLTAAAQHISDTVEGALAPAVSAGDLSRVQDVERIVADLESRFGGIDVVVHAAGGNVEFADDPHRGETVPAASALQTIARRWNDNLASNVLSAVLLSEAVTGILADNARIVLLSSIAAYRGSGTGSYAAAKAALHPYAFDLAARLGHRGATVNVVAPGYVSGTEFFHGKLTEARENVLIGQTLVSRAGSPEDVAETVHWLSSPAAAHISAQIIQVNGGALYGR